MIYLNGPPTEVIMEDGQQLVALSLHMFHENVAEQLAEIAHQVH